MLVMIKPLYSRKTINIRNAEGHIHFVDVGCRICTAVSLITSLLSSAAALAIGSCPH